jgi:hypothetical protein
MRTQQNPHDSRVLLCAAKIVLLLEALRSERGVPEAVGREAINTKHQRDSDETREDPLRYGLAMLFGVERYPETWFLVIEFTTSSKRTWSLPV